MKNRLLTARSVSELENKYDETQQMYGQLRDIMEGIRYELETLNPESTDVNEVVDILDGIDDEYGRMLAIVEDCRANGVDNEQQLNLGRERSEKLTETVDELKAELAKLNDIDELRANVSKLESDVSELEAMLAAKSTEAGVRKAGDQRYICTVHEDIATAIDDGQSKLTEIMNRLQTAGPQGISSAVAEAVDSVTDVESSVLSLISEAEQMNSKMGDAIDERSALIEKLADEIDDLEDQLGTLGDDRAEVLVVIDELEAKLDELEAQLGD